MVKITDNITFVIITLTEIILSTRKKSITLPTFKIIHRVNQKCATIFSFVTPSPFLWPICSINTFQNFCSNLTLSPLARGLDAFWRSAKRDFLPDNKLLHYYTLVRDKDRDVGFWTSYDNRDPKFYYNFMLYNISCLDIW